MTATAESHARVAGSPSLLVLLENGAPARQIREHLDALPVDERVAQVLAVTGKSVGALYDAVADAPPLTLDDVVAPGEEGTILYEGRNSLPLFSRFQKRFARTKGDVVVGYNHQTMAFVTGPGYFVVKAASGEGEHAKEPFFDYTASPPEEPAGWPAFSPNDRGLSKPVFGGLIDYVRRVAKGVIVGKAYKRGAPEGSYFSLSRSE
jgi:hypothetical protein